MTTIRDERIERVARAIYEPFVAYSDYEAIPLEEALSRPRHFGLKERLFGAARAALEADAPEIAAAKAEGLLACVEALRWADSIMHAIVENDPDELIADGGISVWHGIERDARRWITNHGNEWKALSDARTARLASLQPEVAKREGASKGGGKGNMSCVLWSDGFVDALSEKDFRDAFVADQVRMRTSLLIRALREQSDRNWSQSDLGRRMGDKPQSTVSRLEDADYGKLTVQTLLEVAAAFDLPLWIEIPEWEDWLLRIKDVPNSDTQRRSFDAERLKIISEVAKREEGV